MLSEMKSQYQKNKLSWQKSFLDGFCQDENGAPLPWMTYPFIEFITPQLNKNLEIFEFGSGSSTLFFAKRVKKVIALESNAKWFEIMKLKIAEAKLDNIELILMKDALENEEYAKYAQNLAAKGINFDLIVVDSLKRSNCVKNSILALKPSGRLILDDSERRHYGKIFEFMKDEGFKQQDFEGIAPAQLRMKNTTIFFKS